MKKNIWKAVLALTLALTMAAPTASAVPVVVQAATKKIRLSTEKKTLNVGKSFTLKLQNATGRIIWKSSKKSVATVTSKGKVKAVASGTATITAKYNKKSYRCEITVNNPKKFDGMNDVNVGPANVFCRDTWKKEVISLDPFYILNTYDGTDADHSTNIMQLTIAPEEGGSYYSYFKNYQQLMSKDYILYLLEIQGMQNGEILECIVNNRDTRLGKAAFVKYRVAYDNPVSGKHCDEAKVIYQLPIGKCRYTFSSSNMEGDYEEAMANADKLIESFTQL
ncbi:MAG: Ig-like domain-containing protein [bacterium]|nr:Ig-like domain-containing protein [bacterium]